MRGGRIIIRLLFSPIFFIGLAQLIYAEGNKNHLIERYSQPKNSHSEALEIPAIVVQSESGISQKKPSITGSTNIITSDQIQLSGHQSIGGLLQAHAGVQVQDLSGDDSKVSVSMRGFGDNAASNSLVLFNGVPIRNPDTGAPDFGMIPISEIDHIEIFPGSQSVLYGDQAVGGYVNIITKKPCKNERSASVSYGSFQTKKGQLVLGDLFNNGFGYRVSAIGYDTKNYRDHNDDRTNNLNALVSYRFDSGNVNLNYRKINQHLLMPGALTLEQVYQDRRQAENNVDFNNQDTDIFQFGFEKFMTSQWKTTVDASRQAMTGNGAFLFNQQETDFNEKRQVNNVLPKVTGTFHLGSTPVFSIFGMEYVNSIYDIMDEKSQQNEYAAYGQVKIPLGQKFTGVVGVRHARADDQLDTMKNSKDDATVSNLELSWKMNSIVDLFLRAAGSYRFAKPEENYATLTNNPLKTQTGESYETGFTAKQQRVSISLTGYWLNLKNEIMCIPVANAKYFVYNQNLDPTRRIGAIGDTSYSITPDWFVSADYDVVDAVFSSGSYKGNRIPFVAWQTFRLSSVYAFSVHWKMFVEGIFIGNRYPINDVENRASLLSGCGIYNINLSYLQKYFSVNLEINNVTNKQYYNYSVSTYQNTATNTVYYPAAGISALLSVTVKL